MCGRYSLTTPVEVLRDVLPAVAIVVEESETTAVANVIQPRNS